MKPQRIRKKNATFWSKSHGFHLHRLEISDCTQEVHLNELGILWPILDAIARQRGERVQPGPIQSSGPNSTKCQYHKLNDEDDEDDEDGQWPQRNLMIP